jgi:hypothetical protein
MEREPDYLIPRVTEALAADARVSELELDVELDGDTVVIRGDVPTEDRRRGVDLVVEERFPGVRVRNEVTVLEPSGPPTEEEVP